MPKYNSKSVDNSLKYITNNQNYGEYAKDPRNPYQSKNTINTVKKSKSKQAVPRNASDLSNHSYERSRHLRPVDRNYHRPQPDSNVYSSAPEQNQQSLSVPLNGQRNNHFKTPERARREDYNDYEVGSPQSRNFDVITNLPKQNHTLRKDIPPAQLQPPTSKSLDLDADVTTLNKNLTDYQNVKKFIDSDLCRLPEFPRKHADRQKKSMLEAELRDVSQKISELKRALKNSKIH